MNNRPVALVTGANRGIGRAIALSLSEAGWDIAGIDLKFSVAETTRKSLMSLIHAGGGEFLQIESDISDLDRHEIDIGLVLEKFGRLDLLVNNAGVAPLERLDALETTPESFDRVLDVNLRGTFFLTQVAARHMLEHVGNIPDYSPKIIFITSISAVVSSPSRAEYCISKAGLSMTANIFADRLSESGINVYEIRPGVIQTAMTAPVIEKYNKLIADGLIPQKRWGFPGDVAMAVVGLAKGYFDYSTGMVFEVSGGMDIRSL